MEEYDFGARMEDLQIGRWQSLDSKAEKYNQFSPYAYAANNPIKFIDLLGKDIILITKNKNLILTKDILYQTKAGRALWDKYANSKDVDLYIKDVNFKLNKNSRDQVAGETSRIFRLHELRPIFEMRDGVASQSWKLDLKDPSRNPWFKEFDGLDIEHPDRAIYIIAINSQFLDNGGGWPYVMAEALYHEIDAHIEHETGDDLEEDANYGEDKWVDASGSLHDGTSEGSDLDIILQELLATIDYHARKDAKEAYRLLKEDRGEVRHKPKEKPKPDIPN